ncbi:MAG: CpsD/CapB family tyrosine-protein kinase [Sphingomonas sp.]
MADADLVSFRFGEELTQACGGGGPRTEAISALRTRLIAQHLPAGCRSLAVCSPAEAIGCTALTVGLAVALAESGLKVLLIDGDLRRPSVQTFITPSRPVPGLRQCLGGTDTEFGDAIQFDVLPNFSILYAGEGDEPPQDLLSRTQFPQLIDTCLREFDFTIIDTPPSNVSADARRIAKVMGYAVVAVGRDRTFVSDVRALVDELAGDGADVIGTVLIQS